MWIDSCASKFGVALLKSNEIDVVYFKISKTFPIVLLSTTTSPDMEYHGMEYSQLEWSEMELSPWLDSQYLTTWMVSEEDCLRFNATTDPIPSDPMRPSIYMHWYSSPSKRSERLIKYSINVVYLGLGIFSILHVYLDHGASSASPPIVGLFVRRV